MGRRRFERNRRIVCMWKCMCMRVCVSESCPTAMWGGSPIVELSKALPAPGTDTYIITGSRLQRS